MEEWLIGYVCFINIVTFFTFGIDKMKSRGETRRISEKTLWLLTLLGGSPAALFSMKYFRHKTRKLSFQAVIVLIVLLQITAVMSLYKFFK